jgi:protein-disulfide isomerase
MLNSIRDLELSTSRIEHWSLMVKIINRLWVVIFLAWLLCLCTAPIAAASQSRSLKDVLASMEKGPALGSASAPVTIVEFSDFRCSYCKKFWADTLPKLKASYFDKGTVYFVFRHFAILGKQSEQAALASECAAEQGKFWPYHDKLFTNQGALGFSESKLKGYARELRLQEANFNTCLTTGKYRAKVEHETVTAAYLGGRGTPMFLVNEWLLVGAQPFETFQKVIDQAMELSKVQPKKAP